MRERIFLVADDDEDDVDIFREALNSIDPTIICYSASDGGELMQKLESGEFKRPDIVFLDVNMPLMNGWECLEKLKENPSYISVPVIIYSTSAKKGDAEMALKLGALCFYTKPTSFTQLLQVLDLVASNLGGDILAALRNYEGLKGYKIFA